MTPLRVLILDDSANDAELAMATLERSGFACEWDRVDTREAFVERLAARSHDLILADYRLPAFDGLGALELFKEQGLDVPFILISGTLGEEQAIESMRAGATDYVLKTRLSRLAPVVRRALDEAAERRRRREAEGELRDAEQRLAMVFHESLDAIFISDPESGAIVQANDAAGRLLRCAPASLAGAQVSSIVSDGSAAAGFEGEDARRPARWEAHALRADGTSFPVEVTSTHAAWGSEHALLTTLRDISERRRAEEALREEAAVAEALARAGRELISSLDSVDLLERLCRVTAEVLGADTSHTLLRRADDDTWEPIAGWGATPEEQALARRAKVPGRLLATLLERLDADDVAEVGTTPDEIQMTREQRAAVQLCMALRRGRELIGLQVVNRRGHGGPATPTERRIASGIARLASLAIDHVRLVDELERANHLKSDFLATMSHELRTPLHIITGYVDLLLEGGFDPISDDQRDALQRVAGSARKLLDLINATLELSRLEAGRVPLALGPVSLTDGVRDVRQETREACERSGLEIVWEASDDLPEIHTDRVKVGIVLKNLVDNAVKFTEHGRVTVTARRADGGVEISVADTGVGIAAAALPAIFESFRQLEGSLTRAHGGVGLGLYVVRVVLDLLGGRIAVESEPGRGSTFRVHLPLAPPPPAAAVELPAPASPAPGK